MPTLKPLTASDVVFSIHCIGETDSPESHFAMGIDPDTGVDHDAEICAEIRKQDEWNQWAWCGVEVKATWQTHEGSDFLGGCCFLAPSDYFPLGMRGAQFDGEKEFREGGYYEQMQEGALDELNTNLQALADSLAVLEACEYCEGSDCGEGAADGCDESKAGGFND